MQGEGVGLDYITSMKSEKFEVQLGVYKAAGIKVSLPLKLTKGIAGS